jgi:hypothetical protein
LNFRAINFACDTSVVFFLGSTVTAFHEAKSAGRHNAALSTSTGMCMCVFSLKRHPHKATLTQSSPGRAKLLHERISPQKKLVQHEPAAHFKAQKCANFLSARLRMLFAHAASVCATRLGRSRAAINWTRRARAPTDLKETAASSATRRKSRPSLKPSSLVWCRAAGVILCKHKNNTRALSAHQRAVTVRRECRLPRVYKQHGKRLKIP